MSLIINNVSVRYSRVEAVKDVSIAVEPGQVVALIGANGAGKTSILRAISRLTPSAAGEIVFEGRRVEKLPAHKIAELGIAHVPEGRTIFSSMTVMENLLMGGYLQKSSQRLGELLTNVFERFPVLEQRKNQRAGSMSGGEQQMLAIGRALMADPKVLLMDEPSLGLAPLMVREIGRIISDIHKTGVAILLAEQNARLALALANYGHVMETGTITLSGKTKDLIGNDDVRRAYLGL